MLNAPLRRIGFNQVLSSNPLAVWQLALALATSMLALGLAIAGLGYVAILAGMVAVLILLVSFMTFHGLLTEDLRLLRHGVQVMARVHEEVPDARLVLYRVSFHLPDHPQEHSVVFRSWDGTRLRVAEPVAILVDKSQPDHILEITGRYDYLFPPAPSDRQF